MINPIGGYGSYVSSFGGYKGYAANNHEKLYKALEKRLGSDKAMELTKVTKDDVAALEQDKNTTSSASQAKSFVQDYTKKMTDIKSAASALVNPGKADETPETVAGKVETLVNAYNRGLKLLNDNYDKGSGVLNQMRNMLTLPVSEKTLNSIGVTVGKDGTMSVDKEKLTTEMKRSPESVKSLISGSYSLAQGLMKDANQGLSISSARLTDGMKTAASLTEFKNTADSFNNYSYGRNTYAAVSNYKSMGSMLNMLI